MLRLAGERRVYDDLKKAELVTYLRGHPEAFDVVISADTLCYFGVLEGFAGAAFSALDADWCLPTKHCGTTRLSAIASCSTAVKPTPDPICPRHWEERVSSWRTSIRSSSGTKPGSRWRAGLSVRSSRRTQLRKVRAEHKV